MTTLQPGTMISGIADAGSYSTVPESGGRPSPRVLRAHLPICGQHGQLSGASLAACRR